MEGNTFCHSKEGGTYVPPRKLRNWLKLFLAIVIIILLIKAASFSEYIPWIKKEFKALRESDIQTGLFWWADVHEVAEAERHFKKLNLIKQSFSETDKLDKSKNNKKKNNN